MLRQVHTLLHVLVPIFYVLWIQVSESHTTINYDTYGLDLYSTSSEIEQSLKHLASSFPYNTKLYSRHTGNHTLYGLHVFQSTHHTKNNKDCQVKMMFVCGQHARELISPQLCERFARRVTEDVAYSKMSSRYEGVQFMFVPLVEPSGRDAVMLNGKTCQRTNPHGVDLNRNWDRLFTSSPYSLNSDEYLEEEYPGRIPYDQMETKIVSWLMSEFTGFGTPDILINVHSGDEMILYPFDSTEEEDVSNKNLHHAIAKHLRDRFCKRCKIGPGSKVLYKSTGTMMDSFSYSTNNTLAFTWEIYGTKEIANFGQDCFPAFNPLSKSQYNKVMIQWSEIFLEQLRLISRIRKSPHSIFCRNSI